MSPRPVACLFALLAIGVLPALAQVIEFESGGLRYQSLSRNGLTVMFSRLQTQVRGYRVIQVAISNGTGTPQFVRPEDFLFEQEGGARIPASSARDVVNELITKARRGDVIKLVAAYEQNLYGTTRMNSTSGYEQRRQSALAEVQSAKIKAAAAASAIALVPGKLAVGESTDGAVFFQTDGKPLGTGVMTFRAGKEFYRFKLAADELAR
jgi:hypothetical protein